MIIRIQEVKIIIYFQWWRYFSSNWKQVNFFLLVSEFNKILGKKDKPYYKHNMMSTCVSMAIVDDKLMYKSNDDTQNYPLYRLKRLDIQIYQTTN